MKHLIVMGIVAAVCASAYALPTDLSGGSTSVPSGGSPSEPLQYWLGSGHQPWGDFDFDGDVDQGDFLIFAVCFNGPNRAPKKLGVDADWDRDGDVDQGDFLAFQLVYGGPNAPPKLGKPRPSLTEAENPEPLTIALVATAIGGMALEKRRRARRTGR